MAHIGVDANGVRYKFAEGDFIVNVSTTINCGFKPKIVFVIKEKSEDVFALDYFNEDLEIDINRSYLYGHVAVGRANISVQNDKFIIYEILEAFIDGTAHYVAIG